MKHYLQTIVFTILVTLISVIVGFADDHGKIIKERKLLFKQNYSHAKRMSAEISKGNIDKVIELSEKMSINYDKLLDLFPENSKSGYETEALPAIWLLKDEFNALMIQTSEKVKEFSIISVNLTANELKDAQKKLVWSSCKACHDKFRMPH